MFDNIHDKRCLYFTGWTVECLQEWGMFFKLALFGMLMICVEWWAFEIGVFLTGSCFLYCKLHLFHAQMDCTRNVTLHVMKRYPVCVEYVCGAMKFRKVSHQTVLF